MLDDSLNITFEGEPSDIAFVSGWIAAHGDRVKAKPVVVGDPATTLAIVASALAIIELTIALGKRLTARENTSTSNAKVVIILPGGKRLDLNGADVEAVKQEIEVAVKQQNQAELEKPPVVKP